MNENLTKELDVVFKLAKEQAAYIDRLELLVNELWTASKHVKDALDEAEASIVGQGLKPLLDHCVGRELQFSYGGNHEIT